MIIKKCLKCDKKFKIYPSRTYRKHCSRICAYSSNKRSEKISKALLGRVGHNQNILTRRKISTTLKTKFNLGIIKFPIMMGEDNPNYKNGKPKCGDCGKQLTHYNYRMCIKCSGKRKSGEKSRLWRGGAMKDYPELYAFRKTSRYRNIMAETKKRDDFRCLWCGERGKILHSDHIRPFINYPKLRLDSNNIQTLCFNCHKIKTKGDKIGIYTFN